MLNTKWETSFIVMPSQCNFHYPMIFGGAFMAELDLAAATVVTRFLYDSVCDSAVTYKVNNITFHAAAQCGDLIILKAKVIATRVHAIVVSVEAFREKRNQKDNVQEHIASAEFVFVSRLDGKVSPHGLTIKV